MRERRTLNGPTIASLLALLLACVGVGVLIGGAAGPSNAPDIAVIIAFSALAFNGIAQIIAVANGRNK